MSSPISYLDPYPTSKYLDMNDICGEVWPERSQMLMIMHCRNLQLRVRGVAPVGPQLMSMFHKGLVKLLVFNSPKRSLEYKVDWFGNSPTPQFDSRTTRQQGSYVPWNVSRYSRCQEASLENWHSRLSRNPSRMTTRPWACARSLKSLRLDFRLDADALLSASSTLASNLALIGPWRFRQKFSRRRQHSISRTWSSSVFQSSPHSRCFNRKNLGTLFLRIHSRFLESS